MASKRDLWQEIREGNAEHYEESDDYKYISDDQDQLVNAVSAKNVEKLRRLLSRGVDPYFVDYEGKSPLHIVCSMPSEPKVAEMLELLVYFGCALDVSDRFGCLPIHIAASVSADHVRLLLDAGSPINRQDNAGRTPLMLACTGECLEALSVVQYLLDRNANVTLTDADGYTSLHYLCRHSHHPATVRNEIVYKLLYAGLPADVVDSRGAMPICYEIDLLSTNSNNKDQQYAVIQTLIQSGSKLDVRNKLHERIVKTWMIEGKFGLISDLLYIAELSLTLRTLKSLHQFCHNCITHITVNGIRRRLLDLTKTVRPLKVLCCQTVREELGGQVLQKAELLPIPRTLQKNLLLLDL